MKKTEIKKLKVMSIFGVRPEIIRLSRTLIKLDEYVNHIMVHTGQSYDYEMNKVFFEDLNLREPDYFLGVKADTLGGQIANIISKSEEVLIKENPDAVLICEDVNSALSAMMARRLHIPIFHMGAGNRSFDYNVPEEMNRKIVDHISDINMPYSENARQLLLREGIHPGTIFTTGGPLTEVYHAYKSGIDKSKILEELKYTPKKYFVASVHREENVDSKENFLNLIDCLNTVADIYRMPIFVTTHPRTQKRIEEYGIKAHELINFHKPVGYFDYNRLQKDAFCVLSDSGSIHEESAAMDFPAVQMRMSQERSEAFDEGISVLAGRDKDVILQAIELMVGEREKGVRMKVPNAYDNVNFSSKVVRLILGMTKTVASRHLI